MSVSVLLTKAKIGHEKAQEAQKKAELARMLRLVAAMD